MKLYEILVNTDKDIVIITDDMGNDTEITAMWEEGYVCGLSHIETGSDIGNYTAISEAEVESLAVDNNKLIIVIAYDLTPEEEESENECEPDSYASLRLDPKNYGA